MFSERRAAFRSLHDSGCFVLPNPWDGGTALRLAKAGFKALASTSAGAAWSLGKADGEMTLLEVLEHLRFLCTVTELPINADFEAGFAPNAQGVAENVAQCVDTGVAGLSIEDRDGSGLFPIDDAAARVAAAKEAIERSGQTVVLVARCEAYLMDPLDLDETIKRLIAYQAAGADCLYAPGVLDLKGTTRLVGALSKPLNANLTGTGLSVKALADIGVRRVSVGAALAKATYAAFDGFAERLAKEGRLPESL